MYQQRYRQEVQVRRAWQPCFRPLLASALGLKIRKTHAASAQYLPFMETEAWYWFSESTRFSVLQWI